MSRELDDIKELRCLIYSCQENYIDNAEKVFLPILDRLEKRIKVLETIRDSFDLQLEPNYKATLQFQQCCTMSQSEYEEFIKYFGEPKDE